MRLTSRVGFALVLVLELLQTVASLHAQQMQPSTTIQLPSIAEKCRKEQDENDWPMRLYRDCVYKLEREQAQRIQAQACNNNVCFYLLDWAAEGIYRGHGYTLELGTLTAGNHTAVLTSEDGKKTFILVQCGAAECGAAYTVSGAIPGATFKGPYFKGPDPEDKSSYYILQLPVIKQQVVDANKSRTTACENEAVLPCGLQSRVIDYHFNIDGEESNKFHQWQKETRPIVEQLKFTKSDDVYLFQGRDNNPALLSDNGYLYKFNQQIDFSVNRLRAPPNTSWDGVRYMKGTIALEKDELARKLAATGVRDGREWTYVLETRIKLSKDFQKCSVVGFSWTGSSFTGPNENTYQYRLARAAECTIR